MRPATELIIPFNFEPRKYQIPFLAAMDSGTKRAVCVWHRRAGKDKTLLNLMVKKMIERVGSYYYFMPTYSQGRKILWDGMDRNGFRFMDHFPKEILDGVPNSTEMRLKLKNGSLFQIIGSDNIDSIVGTNPIGCIFSEFSLQDPSGWDFVRPILAENDGWAVFNFTPRGKNHAYNLFRMAEGNKDWFCQRLTADDTGAITKEMIQAERDAGMSEELIQQEFYCSFDGPLDGSVFGNEMRDARKEGRICRVPHDPALLVDTWWDIGVGNNTAIWFTQTAFNEVRVIDYHEDANKGIDHYARVIKDKKYHYGEHNGPHDLMQRQKGDAKTLHEFASNLGLQFNVKPRTAVGTQIEAARLFLPRCVFDEKNCFRGIDALCAYRFEWDDKKQMFKDKPLHDWASDGADAFKLLAVNHQDATIPDTQDRYSRGKRRCQSWMSA